METTGTWSEIFSLVGNLVGNPWILGHIIQNN